MNNQIILLALLAAGLFGTVVSAAYAGATPEAIAAVAPEHLTQGKLTAQEYAFKRHVYTLHVERGVKAGRARLYDLPPSELADIPGTKIIMRKDAAAALGKLLAAARADLKADLAATGADPETADRRARAQKVQDIEINNAYRSASTQFAIWDRNFAGYLAATKAERAAAPGGEFGEAAAELLRNYIGLRLAAPGFSNHQGGIAVDFSLALKPVPGDAGDGRTLGPSMAQVDSWKESWFWRWLVRRAGDFGFAAYAPEPWHWEYLPERAGKESPK